MTLRFNATLRSERADQTRDTVDASAQGKLIIYSGTQPATGGAPTGSALVTFTFPNPSAPNAAAGVSTYNTIPPENIAISGGATWFRVTDGAAGFVFDGTVTVTGGGGDMQLDSTTFVSGRLISIDSFVITEGNP